MKFRGLIVAAIAVVGLALLLDSDIQGGDKKDPVSIKFVMQKAHKGKDNLLSKVSSGKASDEEKKLLIALYTDLAANKNPKGDEKDWKFRTEALLQGAKTAKEDGGKSLKNAADCNGCHSRHK